MDRKWVPVKGYENLYEINEEGLIKNRHSRMMRFEIDRDGYLRIGLSKNGKQKRYLVSRLVAQHFLDPSDKETINHLNGDKKNNNRSNLQWASRTEQNHHALQLGLRKNKGADNPNSKLTYEQVCQIKALLRDKNTLKSIAAKFNVSWGLIGFIKQGRIWKHVSI